MQINSLDNIIAGIASTAGFLWEKGWAERNAGNISVNITGLLTPVESEIFDNTVVRRLATTYSSLAGQTFLVTSSGSRMRDLSKNPWDHICLLKIDKSGNKFNQWPDPNREPTSELPTHLAVHDMFILTNSSSKILLHSHVTELIALTQIRELCSTEALNRLLWGMHPETILFAPKGLGFIPYEINGTVNIAKATVKVMENHPVALWEKHGVLASGTSVEDAFDIIDLLAKAAKIFFLVKSAGFEPEGLTDNQIQELQH
jgi:rhamnulose-1-phosphate aldolase